MVRGLLCQSSHRQNFTNEILDEVNNRTELMYRAQIFFFDKKIAILFHCFSYDIIPEGYSPNYSGKVRMAEVKSKVLRKLLAEPTN